MSNDFCEMSNSLHGLFPLMFLDVSETTTPRMFMVQHTLRRLKGTYTDVQTLRDLILEETDNHSFVGVCITHVE